MADVAIITAVYDQYDVLKPTLAQQNVDVDWVYVTDVVPDDSLGWRVVYEPQPSVHPNRAAKRPKFLPWLYTDAPASVWVDGSFRIISDRFAVEALSHANPIAQFKHPWRDCLYAEAIESAAIAKYETQIGLAEKQAAAYRSVGHPEHWGLWATGVIARHHTEQIKQFGHHWLEEVDQWTFQDQISHPFSLRESGLRPAEFPGMHLANGWLQYEGSARH